MWFRQSLGIRGALIAIAACGMLVGAQACGDDDDEGTAVPSGQPSAQASDEPTDERPAPPVDRLVLQVLNDQPDMDVLSGGSRGDLLADNVYETLVWMDSELVTQPRLASSWEQIDPTTWQFVLEEGIKFDDGSDFTAEDVAATVNYVVGTPTGLTVLTGYINGAEVVDDYTVNITSEFVDAVDRWMVWMPIVPSEVLEDPESLKTIGVPGTGPYRVLEHNPGQDLLLERRDDYWGGDVALFPEVLFQYVPEVSVRLANLTSGNAHYAPLTCALLSQAPQALTRTLPLFSSLRFGATPETDGLAHDRDVRMALALALDKDALIEGVLGGCAEPWDGSFQSTNAIGYVDLGPYPYDPDQARELLEEAGVVGETITLWARAGGDPGIGGDMAQAIAQMWEEVGIHTDLQILPREVVREAIIQTPGNGHDPADVAEAVLIPHDDVLGSPSRLFVINGCARGYSTFCDPDGIEELIAQVNQATSVEDQQELVEEINRASWEQVPWIGIARVHRTDGAAEWIQYTPRSDARLPIREFSVK